MAALDGHFHAEDCSPADADRWRELKRHVVRMMDGLGLARIELEGPLAADEKVGKALGHVRFGLGIDSSDARG